MYQAEPNNNIDLHGHTTLTYNDDKSIKLEGAYKNNGIHEWTSNHEDETKFTLSILKLPPITYEDSYKYETSDNKMKVVRKTSIKYDQKDLSVSIDPLTFDRDLSHIELKAKASTPYKMLHHIDLDLKHLVRVLHFN